MINPSPPSPNISPTPPTTSKWSGKNKTERKKWQILEKKMANFGKEKIGKRIKRKIADFGREKLEMTFMLWVS